MVLHRNLAGAQLHEPKGISGATEGQVYTADGTGSGEWADQIGTVYGGIVVNDAAVAISSIGTTAQKFTAFNDDMSSNGIVPDSTTDNDLTVPSDGVYLVTFSVTFATAAIADAGLYQFRLRVNGSEPSTPNNIGLRRAMSGSADTGTAVFHGLVTLSSGAVLTVWVESDEAGDSDDIQVNEAHFTAEKRS